MRESKQTFNGGVKSLLKNRLEWKFYPYALNSRKPLLCILALSLSLSNCKKSDLSEKSEGLQTTKNTQETSSSGGPDFSIAIIPDTQYYTSPTSGGTMAMFQSQINWIKNNQVAENIAYVVHLGDISDHGDSNATEWVNASNALYGLESPVSIPYGTAVGNHDQTPNTGFPLTCTTNKYNQYFGRNHFAGRSYYGNNLDGSSSNNNDSHYDLFTAGGISFIVIYLEYDGQNTAHSTTMNNWAYNLLGSFSGRKAIIVTHNMIGNGNPGPFSTQGQGIYNAIKSRPNVVMMLGGHHAGNGEGYRIDTYNGTTVKSMLSDYQGRVNGGNGLMRLIKFSPVNDVFNVTTFSPSAGISETDSDSQFSKPLLHDIRTCYFDQGGATDKALFNAGTWKVSGTGNVVNGASGDIPVPGDYDGDGDTERAVWKPSTGDWIIPGMPTVNFGSGAAGDIPVPADYNGDGKTDIAVWRTTDQIWRVVGMTNVQYGASTDIPVPADYNGDGKADRALFRPGVAATWYIQGMTSVNYGTTGDIPVPGDYDGNGIVEKAIFRPSTGNWHINGLAGVNYGQAGDIPAPGDYDGNGLTDKAVWRPSTNEWYVNGAAAFNFGASGDKPVALPYAIRKFFFP